MIQQPWKEQVEYIQRYLSVQIDCPKLCKI